MRLVRFAREEGFGWGAVVGDAVVDLSDVVGDRHGAIHRFLSEEGQAELARTLSGRSPSLPLAELEFAPFLPDPEKIICVGVNYPDRNAEYRDASAAPEYPSLFLRAPGSFVAHGEPLVRPRESMQLDYEGEIVLVIGKPGRRIPREEALGHVAGVTLMNEGSIRDWLRHSKFNVTQGKNFDRSGSVGPWMVTADEAGDLAALPLETRVNGEVRQSDTTASLMFDVPYLVSYVSSFTTLKPGDLLSTGTPTGAGARFDPPRYLKPGDVVEVSCPAIGTLRNGVVDG